MFAGLTLEKIVSFAKRRGFVFPSSDIYGGFAAVYDFGHYDVGLAKSIREATRKPVVGDKENLWGLESAF